MNSQTWSRTLSTPYGSESLRLEWRIIVIFARWILSKGALKIFQNLPPDLLYYIAAIPPLVPSPSPPLPPPEIGARCAANMAPEASCYRHRFTAAATTLGRIATCPLPDLGCRHRLHRQPPGVFLPSRPRCPIDTREADRPGRRGQKAQEPSRGGGRLR